VGWFSNVGLFGVRSPTPIIDPGQTLARDHRLIDGAAAIGHPLRCPEPPARPAARKQTTVE